MKSILVFGSIVQDLISYCDDFPRPGESVRGNSFSMGNGGKGANQAVQIAKLGGTVKMVASVGNDTFGHLNKEILQKENVDVSDIFTTAQSTGTASIYVDNKGENCIIVTLGANLLMNKEKAKQMEKVISESSIVMIQNEIDQEGNLEVLKIAKKHNVRTFYNPAPGLPNLLDDYLKLSDIVVTNENEAEFLIGHSLNTDADFIEAAKTLLNKVNEVVIITRGSKSTIIATKKDNQIETQLLAIEEVKAVDTTGAGDSFCGALVYAIMNKNYSIIDGVKFGSKIAALSVQKKGTQSSYPCTLDLNDD
uniref:Ribokinase n=1 Tax=Rhabditophanes sp. KR3021 TaxID=114890 RepID=A0AC35UAI1_9BILA